MAWSVQLQLFGQVGLFVLFGLFGPSGLVYLIRLFAKFGWLSVDIASAR